MPVLAIQSAAIPGSLWGALLRTRVLHRRIAVGQRAQKCHDGEFLIVRETKIPDLRAVFVTWHLGCWPASAAYLPTDRGSQGFRTRREHVARIVEMHGLVEAL